MSSLDFFSALDVDDDVNELLEHPPAGPPSAANAAASTAAAAATAAAATTAHDLLNRIMQHQQAQARRQHPAAAASAPRPAVSNLVDGLMAATEDGWNGAADASSIFDDAVMGAVGSPDHPAVPLISNMPPPPPPGPPRPVTTADLAAAFWNGHARGAMTAAAASGAITTAASAPAPSPLTQLANSLGSLGATSTLPSIPSSATALTANLATANALATTEALNAQLLQHWLTSQTGPPAPSRTAPPTTTMPWDPSPLGSIPSLTSSTSGGLDIQGLAQLLAAPVSAPAPPAPAPAPSRSLHPPSILDQLLSSRENTISSLTEALRPAASTAQPLRLPSLSDAADERARRDAETAASLLGSHLQLAARTQALNGSAGTSFLGGALAGGLSAAASGVGTGAAGAAAGEATAASVRAGLTDRSAVDGDNIRSGSAASPGDDLFSELLEQLSGADDEVESIGTVDACDSDDEDEMPTLEDVERPDDGNNAGGSMVAGSAAAAPAASGTSNGEDLASAAASGTSNGGDGVSDIEGNGPAALKTEEDATDNSISTDAAVVTSVLPRRSRRQAALRGLERISTALATHGMCGSPSGDEGDSKPAAKPDSKPRAKGGRNKKPTIIPKPGSKKAAEEKEETPETCCICLEEPTREELATIHVCVHPFCFSCIEKWADQENTCPLCKARFYKIDKVHKGPRKRRATGCGGEGAEGERSTKRVRNRDQRSDVHSFVNPLEGIFASMEANGTWPTHIAQLLFSGLGASTLGGGPNRAASTTSRFGSALPGATAQTTAFAQAAAARRQRESRQAAATATAAASAARPSGFRYQHPATTTLTGDSLFQARPQSSLGGAGAARPLLGLPGIRLPSPPQRPPARTATTAAAASSRTAPSRFSLESSSPWSASASVSVTLGPQGFAGRSSSTRTTSFQAFNSGSNSSSASSRATAGSGSTSTFLTGDEEEELLSMSPSDYIRRLHRELEGGSASASGRQDRTEGQYRFSLSDGPSARRGGSAGRAATSRADNPFSMFSAAPVAATSSSVVGRRNRGNNAANRGAAAAGRAVETVEIASESDDDDVVEVIDVEALI